MFRGRKDQGGRGRPDPMTIYLELRHLAMTEGPATIPADVGEPDVIGVVIDIPSDGGTATIAALADGTTSMYTSTGGGVIGAGDHAVVAAATRTLLRELQGSVDIFPADDRVDLPTPGLVQFTVLTRTGRRRASIPAAAFWGQEPSTVTNLIAAAQDVLTALGQVDPGR